jgi:hypothetical protein
MRCAIFREDVTGVRLLDSFHCVSRYLLFYKRFIKKRSELLFTINVINDAISTISIIKLHAGDLDIYNLYIGVRSPQKLQILTLVY